MGTREEELAHEQRVVDDIYAVLDATRDHYRARQRAVAATQPGGSPQNRSERDAQAAHYGDQAHRLDNVEDRLVFGRLDTADADTRYIGRVGLSGADHEPLLIDWRAPAARPFYQATALKPAGLVRRRHLLTRLRRVTGIEDEVFDVEAASTSGLTLQGEGALMAALSQGRSGRMGDIVSTIQAEQDEIIRADTRGLLVVQGGPGTGKTAVALHRAAYLLYAEAERLNRSGVLIVGPSATFLRYIEQVLPTLGETGVVSTTLGDLVPGLRATATESPTLAAIKGSMRWVDILAAATRSLERVPKASLHFEIDGLKLTLQPSRIATAIERARRDHPTHNGARAAFVADILTALTTSYISAARAQGQDLGDADRGWVREELRTHRDVRREVNLCWMPYTPENFLRRLFARPALLEEVAGDLLSADERAAIAREYSAPLTEADIVLIDQLSETLGEFEDPRALRRAELERRQNERALTQARDTLANAGFEDGLTRAADLVDRASAPLRGNALAERAAADRTWTYGHIVVDEAQELSPLAWEALLRRCPSRSLTVVGDLAQRHAPTRADRWADLLGPAARALRGEAVLSVCYRTPATIMDAAERVARAAGHPSPHAPRAVRDVADALTITTVPDVDAAHLRTIVEDEIARLDARLGSGAGTLAVIAATDVVADIAAATGWATDALAGRIGLCDARASKGLEFDTVVLVDPAAIGEASPGDLYVAMTRPTTRLHIVTAGRLPAGLRD
ncbi:AAA family ATPase [Nanchangia anserum]|uniref:AAA family ATPase n=1 Tax=Nanchangia anserum TaxID=2692125 RepID=A0A8I0GE28_9ACTO|nr:AAA family ATPase [Nanchangia anserum]MBD3690251.1 AAA family ATPase [Nanchangia anserum]QOX82307.1 AAA family ATPase [Nanchangia anserum]